MDAFGNLGGTPSTSSPTRPRPPRPPPPPVRGPLPAPVTLLAHVAEHGLSRKDLDRVARHVEDNGRPSPVPCRTCERSAVICVTSDDRVGCSFCSQRHDQQNCCWHPSVGRLGASGDYVRRNGGWDRDGSSSSGDSSSGAEDRRKRQRRAERRRKRKEEEDRARRERHEKKKKKKEKKGKKDKDHGPEAGPSSGSVFRPIRGGGTVAYQSVMHSYVQAVSRGDGATAERLRAEARRLEESGEGPPEPESASGTDSEDSRSSTSPPSTPTPEGKGKGRHPGEGPGRC